MRTATTDRGAFLNVAGLQGLSPALVEGEPRLGRGKETAGRCGWPEFFAAVERSGVALVWDESDPEATSLVPAALAHGLFPTHSLAQALERTRRFVEAFLARGPAR